MATEHGFRHRPIPFRYVWPSELDLMARLAGLRLRERWGDWHGAPVTAESRSHVSVWAKPDAFIGAHTAARALGDDDHPNACPQARSGSTRKTTRSLRSGYAYPVYLCEIRSMMSQAASPSTRSTTPPRIAAIVNGSRT